MPLTMHVPVVIVARRWMSRAKSLRGLTAGADDFLAETVDEIALHRAHAVTFSTQGDARRAARARHDLRDSRTEGRGRHGRGGRRRWTSCSSSRTSQGLAELLVTALKELRSVEVESDAPAALMQADGAGEYDLAVRRARSWGLRRAAALQPVELATRRTRGLPISCSPPSPRERARILRAL